MFLTQTFSDALWARTGGLLGDLLDLERSGLLGLVRVVGPRVDLQLLQDLPAQLVLREHAPHGLLDRLAGVLLEHLADRRGGQAARVAGVAGGPPRGLSFPAGGGPPPRDAGAPATRVAVPGAECP